MKMNGIYNIESLVDKAVFLASSSSFVRTNDMYNSVFEQIDFRYIDAPVMNSYAALDVEDDKQVTYIATFKGLCTYMCMFAEIFNEYKRSKNHKRAIKSADWIVENLINQVEYAGYTWEGLDFGRIGEFYTKYPMYSAPGMKKKCQELALKMILGVLCHECGHLCLGHLHGETARTDNSISRNQEREADSFSCSMMLGTGLGSDFFIGNVLSMLSLYFLGKGNSNKFSTHPVTEERILNILRSFEHEIMYSGFNINDIKKLMRL